MSTFGNISTKLSWRKDEKMKYVFMVIYALIAGRGALYLAEMLGIIRRSEAIPVEIVILLIYTILVTLIAAGGVMLNIKKKKE